MAERAEAIGGNHQLSCVAVKDKADPIVARAQQYLRCCRAGGTCDAELQASFTMFYESHQPLIRWMIQQRGLSGEHAAECNREVWAEIVVSLANLREPTAAAFVNWLSKVVRTAAVKQIRLAERLRKIAPLDVEVVDDSCDPSQFVERKAEFESMHRWLDRLRAETSSLNYQVFYLRVFEQLPVAKVAAKLGLTREQVWYRCHRTLNKLRTYAAEVRENP